MQLNIVLEAGAVRRRSVSCCIRAQRCSGRHRSELDELSRKP